MHGNLVVSVAMNIIGLMKDMRVNVHFCVNKLLFYYNIIWKLYMYMLDLQRHVHVGLYSGSAGAKD